MTLSTTSMLRVRSSRRSAPRLFRSPAALVSITWLVGLVLASATSPLWLAYGPLEQDLTSVLSGPTLAHPLGTDELGRDLLSRIVTAAAPTLLIALIAPVVAVVLTTPLTLWAARYPRPEKFIGRASEVVLALPGMVIILAVVAAVGTNMPVIMAVFGLLLFGALYRVLIGQAMSLHRQLYVEAAAVDGVRPMLASVRHVLPNMSTTVVVQFVLLFGAAISIQAGLAFIGLGPQPPEPTWGGMINTASGFIFQQPWMMVPTGGVLALTIIAANVLADVMSGGSAMPPPLISIRRRRTRSVGATTVRPQPSNDGSASDGLVVDDLVISVDDGPDLVTGLSLRVRPGTVRGLVGESGCGKSVTSHAMLGLLTPGLSVQSGSIRWNGVDLSTASEATMQRIRGREIAFISQEPTRALDPMFTVGSQLAGAVKRLRGVSRTEATRIALQLLTDVGIADPPRVLRSYPHEISGGMAQRVAIGLALAGEPRMIAADEPTTALDVTVQAEILALLRALVEEREMAVVIVTHDLGVVADICDEVSVMYAGEIVETGAVRDVLTSPEHPYTMALLSADPHAAVQLAHADTLASIPGQVPVPAEWPTGCRFAERCRFASDVCRSRVELGERAEGTGGVRCARRDEVRGREDEWRLPVTATGDHR